MLPEELKRCVPSFSILPEAELTRIAEAVKQTRVVKDTLLFREGDKGEQFYILVDGEVEIIKAIESADERILAVRGACTLLGELSLFSADESHTASVRALTDLDLLELHRDELKQLLHRQPLFGYELMRTLSQRLVEGEDRTIRDLRRKNRELTQAYKDLQAAQAELVEKERYEKELEVAREIQMSMLPRATVEIPSFNYFARISPMIAVGGDFYDLLALGRERFGLAIGDVSDHGIPAALFMAQTATFLRVAASSGEDPENVLRAVNHHLLAVNEAGMFVTILYGILDASTKTFSYARAGHERPLVLSSQGEILDLEYHRGQPLGLFENPVLELAEIVLPAGSLMALFTDGITDSQDGQQRRFGKQQFVSVLSNAIKTPSKNVVEHVWSELNSFRGDRDQIDDLTIFVLKAD